jgi:hypothetical protein
MSTSKTLHLGTRKGLFTLQRKASGWTIEHVDFLGQSVTMLLEDNRDGTLYAGLALGHFGAKLRRRDEGSDRWDEVNAPAYREGDVFSVPSFQPDVPNTTKPATLKEVWSLETTGDDQPGSLWAGTIPGGLFRSDDRAESWQLIESLWNCNERMDWFGGGKDEPGIHSICVNPRDSKDVTVGISCGGVWQSRDGGDSWSVVGDGLRAEYVPPDQANKASIQDPHRLAMCHANPNVMWVQHHNGVFHSIDHSLTYREIDKAGPSTFGFAVCAHPQNDQIAWFVPGKKDEFRYPVDGQLVVTRTTDGGRSFESLRQGLPQEHCYEIVFRHSLDVHDDGRTLAMGSSTGGLWISEDGGDHWQSISNHLPPIYVTRFSRRDTA